MRKTILLLLLPLAGFAHPGIGIVKDSKGNIFYTDLEKVWKISKGKKTVVLPDMHTHELWIDKDDNLYGENQIYMDEGTNRFDHFLWVLSPEGRLDTIVKRTRAFVHNDYSLSRDADGNEYYVKEFEDKDLTHIYWRRAGAEEERFAAADLTNVHWLYPLKDGSVVYVSNNNIYKARKGETARIIAGNIGNAQPRFAHFNDPSVFGIWDDSAGNIYVAVYSDQAIKKIAPNGTVSDIYRSAGRWGPTSGVFDASGKLWVLETSDQNAVRVTGVNSAAELPALENKGSRTWLWPFISAAVSIVLIAILLIYTKRKQAHPQISRR